MLTIWLAFIVLIARVQSFATRQPSTKTNHASLETIQTTATTDSLQPILPTAQITPVEILKTVPPTVSLWDTITTMTANHLELRVNPDCRCFNDQGFSVDCATWTGYYYTWGPPDDPCLGGPGQGGGNTAGSGGYNYVYSASTSLRVSVGGLLVALFLSISALLF